MAEEAVATEEEKETDQTGGDSTDYENLNDNPEYAVKDDEDEDDDLDDEEEDEDKDDEEETDEEDAEGKSDEDKTSHIEVRDRSEDAPENQDANQDGDDAFKSDIKELGDGRIGGQGIFYGDADRTDLQGEFFTAQTNLWINADFKEDTASCSIPMIYGHGIAELKGTDAHIGVWDTVKQMDTGLWFEGQLNKSHKYADKIQRLIDEGIMGLSSDSIGRLVARKRHEKRGGAVFELTSWPLAGLSLTTHPAEPRLLPVMETDAQAIVGKSFDDLIGRHAEREKARKAALLQIEIERLRE